MKLKLNIFLQLKFYKFISYFLLETGWMCYFKVVIIIDLNWIIINCK